MTQRTLLFYDSEFTGLTQDTSLISIALVSETGEAFYAEFSDYNRDQCDEWIQQNVLRYCEWLSQATLPDQPLQQQDGKTQKVFGDSATIAKALDTWLKPWGEILICADNHAYDWVLFCQLFGGALHKPAAIHYMPLEFSTLLYHHGYDPDCDRTQLIPAEKIPTGHPHNSLWDAQVICEAYQATTKKRQ